MTRSAINRSHEGAITNIHRLGGYGLPLLAVLLKAGCALTPDQNVALDEARVAYGRAVGDSQIVEYAPLALREAEGALRHTERLLAAGAEPEAIEHQAYVTKQRIAIARELAAEGAARAEIVQAEAERQQVLLEARTAEARQAQELAEQRAREAELARQLAEERAREIDMARLEAEKAQEKARELAARAEELSRQVSELEARETERGLVVTLGDLLFDTGEAQLKEGGARAVDKLAAFLNEYPERNVLIEGFTDSTGEEQYNQSLSDQRANAVRDALLADGIDPDRMRAVGYGEQFPVADNETAEGRARNRRVEVIISDPEGNIPDRSQ
jgi:outer membrane protein OmpA-like peptidoglycan-associated protein